MKNKILLGLLLLESQTFAASKYNMPEGVTPMSHAIYDLHMLIFYICVVIAAVVFIAMGYCCVKHRKSKGVVAAKFHDNFALEIAWTIIPTLILVAMAIPASQVLIKIHDMKKSEVNIKIIGMQWRWKYEYLSQGISFTSNLSTPQRQMDGFDPKGDNYLREVDNPLVLPIHKKIRFLVTSSDVQHSWWVPEFGVKRDAIPGLLTSSWATIERVGIYRGKCTELCGMHHGYMPIVVYAVSDVDYAKWLSAMKAHKPLSQKILNEMAHYQKFSEQQRPVNEMKITAVAKKSNVVEKSISSDHENVDMLKDHGKEVYSKNCSVCHLRTGEGVPNVFAALKGSAKVNGDPTNLINTILYGVKGSAMQAFYDKLSDFDLAAVMTYIKTSWGNDDKGKYGKYAGDIVTENMVSELRK